MCLISGSLYRRPHLDPTARCWRRADPPEVISRDKLTTFSFAKKATYSVEFGVYQLSLAAADCDAYDLSPAAEVAPTLFSPMAWAAEERCGGFHDLQSVGAACLGGVGYEATIKLVNSALLVKSGMNPQLRWMSALDLFTGRANFTRRALPPFIKSKRWAMSGWLSACRYSPRGQF